MSAYPRNRREATKAGSWRCIPRRLVGLTPTFSVTGDGSDLAHAMLLDALVDLLILDQLGQA